MTISFDVDLGKEKEKLKIEFNSILNKSIVELEAMDIEDLRNRVLDEVKSLELEKDNIRNFKLQKIFEKLLDLQPSSSRRSFSDEHLLVEEQRLYTDLISIPGLFESDYVRDFLEKKFVPVDLDMSFKRELLINILEFYDKSSDDLIDKFNYIFKSSDEVSTVLLYYPHFLKDVLFTDMLELFDKEDIGQLYRFFLSNSDKRFEFQDSLNNHKKTMFMISVMAKKVKDITGHSAEFLNCFLGSSYDIEEKICFFDVLDSFYDKLVGNKENEESFKRSVLDDGNQYINFLINSIIEGDSFKGIHSFSEFNKKVLAYKNGLNSCVFKRKINDLDDSLTVDQVFKDIDDEDSLTLFKKAFLYDIYGIDISSAKKLVSRYCKYDEIGKDIIFEDRDIYSILMALKNIVELDLNDVNLDDKLFLLESRYLDYLVKGQSNNGISSSIILESLFNRMYLNTYNKRLLKVNGESDVLGYDKGVRLVDAGVDFNIMLTSLSGVNSFYNSELNMASKWNTATFSTNQGMCVSDITNDNLGVISVDLPILGFSHIPECSLNAMGPYDIFSSVNNYDLRGLNDERLKRHFVPGCKIGDVSRYGYNEFLIDRFLMVDEENKIKLQPDYVVFYKLDDNYKDTDVYKKSWKVAKDFGIPIVVIDVLKVKNNEQKILLEKEKEFFSSSFNAELMKEIVTRYMNNYSGTLTLKSTKESNYKEDFSVLGMEEFFDKVVMVIESIDDVNERKQWIDTLESIYREEENKFKVAKRITTFKYSVSEFILKKIGLEDKINYLKNGKDGYHSKREVLLVDDTGKVLIGDDEKVGRNITKDDMSDSIVKVMMTAGEVGVFVEKDKYSGVLRTIVDFSKDVGVGSHLYVYNVNLGNDIKGKMIWMQHMEEERTLIENLVMSYFLEDTSRMIVDDYISYNLDVDVKVGLKDDFDFVEEVKKSPYMQFLDITSPNYIPYDRELVDSFVDNISNLREDFFLHDFKPVIEKMAVNSNMSSEEVTDRLLFKKRNIVNEFAKLTSFIDKDGVKEACHK